MALKPGLRVRQSQRLALTPALRQSISVLQMSATDLADLIQIELTQNPVLVAERDFGPRGRADYQIALETAVHHQSLSERLRQQITISAAPERTKKIAQYLAGNLTDDGYLAESPAETAGALAVSVAQVDQAVSVLQSCEPTGIGARDLANCLELQMVALGETAESTAFILQNFALLADDRPQPAGLQTEQSANELHRLSKVLRSLNPRPGNNEDQPQSQILHPDILVQITPAGIAEIEMDNSTLPSLSVNLAAQTQIRPTDRTTRDYLIAHTAQAQALIRAIEARSKTILRVSQAIVARQHLFFTQGHDFLVPLTQTELAGEMSLHPSTINRAIANKGLACKFGLFPLKFFFGPAIKSLSDDESFSARVIQHQIARIIARETAENTLSDAAIATILRESGVDISRRTVAKYRQCLRITSSAQRRKSKTFL